MGSDEEETEQSPPPIPPRTSSANFERPLILPNDNNGPLIINESNSDSSNSTSSDAPDLLEDTSEDTDTDDSLDDEEKLRKKNFDANSSLPPVPNGTLDLTSPADKQKFSSDEERYEILYFAFLCASLKTNSTLT